MSPLISVIVPIYNVEKYLRQCVDSIINQTYTNLEIILVDDGSPDNCPTICDEYAKKDSRIKVIHKINGGLSDARNAGLKIMSGEYLMFVDSDDVLTSDSIKSLYSSICDSNADIAIGSYEKFNDSDNSIISSSILEETALSQEEAVRDVLLHGCASWARLYRVQIHKNLFFPVGEINEDEAIVLHLLSKCNKVVKTSSIVYRYRFRSESITSTNWSEKKLDWYKHCKVNVEYIRNNYPQLLPLAENRLYNSVVYSLNNMATCPQKYKSTIQAMRTELKRFIKCKNWMGSFSAKEKIRIMALAFFFYPYSKLVRLLGKKYL